MPPLPALFYVHGLLFSAWVVLFLVQARLVAARNVALHRRLGVLGVLLAAAVAMRRRPARHKRLMVLALLTMIAPAGRWVAGLGG